MINTIRVHLTDEQHEYNAAWARLVGEQERLGIVKPHECEIVDFTIRLLLKRLRQWGEIMARDK